MLGVDAYMSQHPGAPGRQSGQSVWVHLVGLCLSLEHDYDGPSSARAKARIATPGAVFTWLEPPGSLGDLTVFDLLGAPSAEITEAVRRWAESVWRAWEPHQASVRALAATLAVHRRSDR